MRIEKVSEKAKADRERRLDKRLSIIDNFMLQTEDKRVLGLLRYAKILLSVRQSKSSRKLDPIRAKINKEINDETSAVARNIRQPWTDEDDKFILTTTMRDQDAALKIGRSKSSVVQRRSMLRRGLAK